MATARRDAATRHAQRLAHTLATATDPFGDAYLLGLFLSDKRLTSTLTLDELLKGLEVRKQGERSVILEYIDQHYPTDQKTIDFCLKAISRRDWLLLSDLSKAHFIRDTRLIGPLLDWVRMDAGHSYATHFALVMLHNHRHLMPDRNGISAELGRIVLPSCRQIDPAKSATNKSLDEWYFWDQELRDLVLTGDRNLVAVLIPYLDRRDIVVDARMIATVNNGVSTRACDEAYNALLDLLDRPGERFSCLSSIHPRSTKEEYAHRDMLIKKLRDELASRSSARNAN